MSEGLVVLSGIIDEISGLSVGGNAKTELQTIRRDLERPKDDWEPRASALKRLAALVATSASPPNELVEYLKPLKMLLTQHVLDLRSQVVKTAAAAIVVMHRSLGGAFLFIYTWLHPHLMKLLTVKALPIRASADECVREICTASQDGRVARLLIKSAWEDDKHIRRRAAEYLNGVCTRWDPGVFDGDLLESVATCLVELASDGDQEVRRDARRGLGALGKGHPSAVARELSKGVVSRHQLRALRDVLPQSVLELIPEVPSSQGGLAPLSPSSAHGRALKSRSGSTTPTPRFVMSSRLSPGTGGVEGSRDGKKPARRSFHAFGTPPTSPGHAVADLRKQRQRSRRDSVGRHSLGSRMPFAPSSPKDEASPGGSSPNSKPQASGRGGEGEEDSRARLRSPAKAGWADRLSSATTRTEGRLGAGASPNRRRPVNVARANDDTSPAVPSLRPRYQSSPSLSIQQRASSIGISRGGGGSEGTADGGTSSTGMTMRSSALSRGGRSVSSVSSVTQKRKTSRIPSITPASGREPSRAGRSVSHGRLHYGLHAASGSGNNTDRTRSAGRQSRPGSVATLMGRSTSAGAFGGPGERRGGEGGLTSSRRHYETSLNSVAEGGESNEGDAGEGGSQHDDVAVSPVAGDVGVAASTWCTERERLESMSREELVAALLQSRQEAEVLRKASMSQEPPPPPLPVAKHSGAGVDNSVMQPANDKGATYDAPQMPPPPRTASECVDEDSEGKRIPSLPLPGRSTGAMEYANARKASSKARLARAEQLRSARASPHNQARDVEVEDDDTDDADSSGDEANEALSKIPQVRSDSDASAVSNDSIAIAVCPPATEARSENNEEASIQRGGEGTACAAWDADTPRGDHAKASLKVNAALARLTEKYGTRDQGEALAAAASMFGDNRKSVEVAQAIADLTVKYGVEMRSASDAATQLVDDT